PRDARTLVLRTVVRSSVLGVLCRHFASTILFFFNHTSTTEIYTLSLHDALPIFVDDLRKYLALAVAGREAVQFTPMLLLGEPGLDRKSTRLNSSHVSISYAVFCLKKKKQSMEAAGANKAVAAGAGTNLSWAVVQR